MFINNCSFCIANDTFIISDFIVYNVGDISDQHMPNTTHIDYNDHKDIIDIYKKSTLDIKQWDGGSDVSIICGNSKIYQDHYVSVNEYIYYVKHGNYGSHKNHTIVNTTDKNIMDNIKKIYALPDNLHNIYGITPIANHIVEFIKFISGSVLDLINIHTYDNCIKLDKFTISNNILNNVDNPVYIPYIIQYMCYTRYNTSHIFDVLLFMIIRCNVEKIIINKDISYFDYMDDNILIDKLVINTSKISIDKFTIKNIVVDKQLAIVLHLDNIYQIKYFAKVLSEIEYMYDLYVTLPGDVENGVLKDISKGDKYDMLNLFFKQLNTKVKYFETSTVGSDMGPFLLVLKTITHYDYVLKLHTVPERKKRDNIIKSIVTIPYESLIQSIQEQKILGCCSADYNYKNHAYLCYLLNKLDIKIFDEQSAIFAEKIYSDIRQAIEYRYSGDKPITYIPDSCYWINPAIISKYNLWRFYSDMHRSKSDKFYQQMPQAISTLISILHL